MNWIDYGLISLIVGTLLSWVILRQRNLIIKDVVMAAVIVAYCAAAFLVLTFYKAAATMLPIALIVIMVGLAILRGIPEFESWLNKRIRLP